MSWHLSYCLCHSGGKLLPVNPSVSPWKGAAACQVLNKQKRCTSVCRGLAVAFVVLKLSFIWGVNSGVVTAGSVSHLRPWGELGSVTMGNP